MNFFLPPPVLVCLFLVFLFQTLQSDYSASAAASAVYSEFDFDSVSDVISVSLKFQLNTNFPRSSNPIESVKRPSEPDSAHGKSTTSRSTDSDSSSSFSSGYSVDSAESDVESEVETEAEAEAETGAGANEMESEEQNFVAGEKDKPNESDEDMDRIMGDIEQQIAAADADNRRLRRKLLLRKKQRELMLNRLVDSQQQQQKQEQQQQQNSNQMENSQEQNENSQVSQSSKSQSPIATAKKLVGTFVHKVSSFAQKVLQMIGTAADKIVTRTNSIHRCAEWTCKIVNAVFSRMKIKRLECENANRLPPNLKRAGFKVIKTNSVEGAQPGDVVVIDSFGSHRWGHAVVKSDTRWVSDFIQRDFNPYRDFPPRFWLFRWDGKQNA